MKKIYFIAIFFAILTGVAVYNYALFLQNARQTENGVVVVAVSRIPENTLITEDMVMLKRLPKNSINLLAVNDISMVKGRISNMALEADEQVLTTKLNEQGSEKNGLAYTIPTGKRAITIAADEISGVAGWIKKSNRVDIIAVLMLNGKSKTVLLLQNIDILETNATTSGNDKRSYTNLTVAVTPEEAAKLFYAQTNGKLTVALRPILDKSLSSVAPYAP